MKHWTVDFLKDLRFAARTMRRNPLFALTAVLSLAVGIGANTAIFTAADAALWRPLPVEHPDRLVRFTVTRVDRRDLISFPATFGIGLAGRKDVFEDAIEGTADGLSFSYDGRAERIMGEADSPNFFTFLGVKTALGQPFSAGVREGRWAAEAVLSYRFWQNRFGGDPAVIGRVIHLNTYPFTIVGVSEPRFYSLSRGMDPELRIPMMPPGQTLPQMQLIGDTGFDFGTIARLRPGVSMAQAAVVAEAEFQDVLRNRAAAVEARRMKLGHVRVLPGAQGWATALDAFETPLYVLLGLVGGVLLIACANVANMLLARAAGRRRELAVRCSVGAGRTRLVRQMLSESLLLGLAGGGLGIAAAWWAGPLLLHFLPHSNIVLILDLHPDLRALAFTSGVAVLTGLLFGLVPALQATRGDLAGALKADSAASIGERQTAFFRKGLIVGQVAFSLALLLAAGWFVRTVGNLRPHELAGDPNRVLEFMIKPQHEIYDEHRIRNTIADAAARMARVPGVESAAFAESGPFRGPENGRPVREPGGNTATVREDTVTPGFFSAIGMQLLAGRDFNAADRPDTPPVSVISQAVAQALYGTANPIGRTFEWTDGTGTASYRVIGVVNDVHYYDLAGAAQPMVFLTFQRFPPYMPVLHVRTSRPDTASMISAIRRAFDEVDKGFPVFNVKTMAMQLDDTLARQRMVADLASAFGLMALLLAAVGLYGVLAYFVTRRTREIGIRMALGSASASIVWLVAKEALQLVGAGAVAGVLLAMVLRRSIATFLFGVPANDAATILAAGALLFGTALLAIAAPALRAARVDPLVALRCD